MQPTIHKKLKNFNTYKHCSKQGVPKKFVQRFVPRWNFCCLGILREKSTTESFIPLELLWKSLQVFHQRDPTAIEEILRNSIKDFSKFISRTLFDVLLRISQNVPENISFR